MTSRPAADVESGLALVGGALASFTLWDFYAGAYGRGIRPFDLLALAALLGAMAAADVLELPRRLRLSGRQVGLQAVIAGQFLVAGLVGVTRSAADARPTIAVWVGVLLFGIFYSARLSTSGMRRLLDVLLIVHVAALVLQMAVFYGAGVLLNYQAIVGGVPRVFSIVFRPSGLFLEPGAYAVTAMLLLLLRTRLVRRLDGVAAITLASVLASVSLFGIIAVAGYVSYRCWRSPRFWMVAAVLFAVGVVYIDEIIALPQALMALERLASLGSDASVTARYGALSEVRETVPTSWAFWFGRGVTNEYLGFGSSSLGFLLTSVGAVGSMLLVGVLLALAGRGERLHVLVSLVFGLVAAPIWTTFFWWAWLGLLTNRSLGVVSPARPWAPPSAIRWRTSHRVVSST